jgi:hypothetical protein
LFGGGWLIIGPRGRGALFLGIAAISATALYKDLSRRKEMEGGYPPLQNE